MQLSEAVSFGALTIWSLLGAAALTSSGYLASLMLAAGVAERRRVVQKRGVFTPDATPKVVVLIPAHNEELVLGATLTSLIQQNYPRDSVELLVVADNCTDTTATIARQREVTVYERTNTELRGKGYALEWGMQKLFERSEKPDAVVIVDADTKVAPSFLTLLISQLFAGVAPEKWATHRCALQGRYGVLNGSESWRASLMEGAFELVNHIKPLGRSALGFSVGLKGNGMGFTRAVLEAAPWQGHSITEDIDYGLDLLLHHGITVGYAPDAVVRAQMPNNSAQAASQRERWERGRYRLLRERALPLLAAGVWRRDLRLIDSALDLIVPPLAELAALHGAWIGFTALCFNMGVLLDDWFIWPVLSLLAYLGYILGGLKVAGANREVYSALVRAPFYTLWKFALYAFVRIKGLRRGGKAEPEWVRTERAPLSEDSARKLEDAA